MQKWLVLGAASTGLILGILDTTVVNIAVPALMRELQASVTQVSWVLNAYSLANAVLFLTLGRLAERYGQRLIFLVSLALFTLFSFACGLAPNVGWLVVFRVGQAIGAAGIVPISLIILLSAFPPAQHGLATGLWGAFGTLAGIVGPPVGGLLLQYASWRWIFFINVPIGMVAIGVSLLVVPELRRDTRAGGVDCLGIALSAGSIGCLILAIAEGNDWGWSSATVLCLMAAALILGSLFVWWEGRTKHPMVPLSLFRVRPFSVSSAMMILSALGMGGGVLMMVLFMVNVLGYSELWAAFGTMPMAAVACVVSPLSGRLVDSLGPRQVAAVGGLLFGTAFLLMADLDGKATLWSLAWRQILLGLGMSLTMPALTAAGLTPLPQQSSGVGSGTNSTARACGSALGVALLLAVFESTQSYSACFLAAGIICFLSVPLSVFLGKQLGHGITEQEEKLGPT